MTPHLGSTAPKLSEADFATQVTDLARICGWEWVHFRAGMNRRGQWGVPVEGPLGKGWPDYVFVHERSRRLLFVELKVEGGKVEPDQQRVMALLGCLRSGPWAPTSVNATRGPGIYDFPSIGVHIWRPSDFKLIERVLR